MRKTRSGEEQGGAMLMESFSFETVFVNSTGVVSARVKKAARRALIPLSAEISLELVEIPSGSFFMGSPGMEGYDDERPRHRVSVQGFLLGRTLVTQAVWEVIMGPHPFRFHGPQHPVDSVSCDAVEKFCNQVSSITGLYCRLPSEAEWEYACRAGGDTPFSTGQTLTTDLANFNGEFPFQGGEKGIYRHETLPVGSFPPNAFGLHDMHGGLWEWTADAWHPDYQGAPVEGQVWSQGGEPNTRVVRGGSWHDPADICRSAIRLRMRANEGDDIVGLRVACDLPNSEGP